MDLIDLVKDRAAEHALGFFVWPGQMFFYYPFQVFVRPALPAADRSAPARHSGPKLHDGFGLEHRPVHADPPHRRAVSGFNEHRAARAAAHGAGHVFFQRDLTGQPVFPGQLGHGLEHGGRAATEDLHRGALIRVQPVQPAAGEFGHRAVKAARIILPAGEARGDAPVVQQGHAGDDPGRYFPQQDLRGARLEREGDLRTHERERAQVFCRVFEMFGQKDQWRDADAAADQQRARPVSPELERLADWADQVDAIAGPAPGQQFSALSVRLVQHFDGPGLGISAHDRHGPAHEQRGVALHVHKMAGPGMGRRLGRLEPEVILPPGEFGLRQQRGLFDIEGIAAGGVWHGRHARR